MRSLNFYSSIFKFSKRFNFLKIAQVHSIKVFLVKLKYGKSKLSNFESAYSSDDRFGFYFKNSSLIFIDWSNSSMLGLS